MDISVPPGPALLSGRWTYDPQPATPSGYSRLSFGQYLYTPAAASTCTRNLTIHVGGAAFWACSTQFLGNASYLDSYECIPDALMMPAYVVDRANARFAAGTGMAGTCLQLSAHHYDYFTARREDFAADVAEAAARPPAKHGIISSVHPDPTYAMATAAALLGLPLIDGNWMGADSMRHSDSFAYPTLLRTLSDARYTLPGVLDLLPETFALLTDDAPGSGLQTGMLQQAVRAAGKHLARHDVVPAFSDAQPLRTWQPILHLVRSLAEEGIRYILLVRQKLRTEISPT